MPLKLDHLEMSCDTLAELLEISNDRDQMEQLGKVVEKGVRAGIVQYFELTYELAVKLIEKQLSEIVANPEDLTKFSNRMREAARAGLIHDPAAYINYRDMRNRTAHTYDCELTEEAVATMPEFLDSVRFLIEELRRRNLLR